MHVFWIALMVAGLGFGVATGFADEGGDLVPPDEAQVMGIAVDKWSEAVPPEESDEMRLASEGDGGEGDGVHGEEGTRQA